MQKPDSIFDRDAEWDALTRFACADGAGATLGIISGRRRQGKTHLLEELCAALGGFYFGATEATSADSLRLLAHALAEHTGARHPPTLDSWEAAVEALLDVGVEADGPVPVVLDEFPYLCAAAPELPSVIQKLLSPRSRLRRESRSRIILCGSAMTFMGRLLSGSAPLRGRAGLELHVPTFDPRTAAAFWGIEDWQLAFRVHAVIGGTPAYRAEYVQGDAPADPGDFDDWVCRTVLAPSSPLRNEARYLLAEEDGLREPALYHSVLAAIAEGNHTRGGIASYVGRPADTLRHPLGVLEDTGLIRRESDALRRNRSTYRVDEPLVRFYHAIMRPEWSRLQRFDTTATVWEESADRFRCTVLGPQFEELARWWTAFHALPTSTGGRVSSVSAGVLNDPAARMTHKVDVVAKDADGRIVAIGEAKVGATMGVRHLRRLERVRELLARSGWEGAEFTRLLCFSGAGFDAELRATSGGVSGPELVDLERIYTGS